MARQIAGFPYWEVAFGEEGQPVEPRQTETLLDEIGSQGVTDLYIFSHGWNNTPTMARDVYGRFFAQVRQLWDDPQLQHARPATLGVVGVIWPAMRWLDEPLVAPDAEPGGAFAGGGVASAGGAAPARRATAAADSGAAAVRALRAVYTGSDQRQALDELAGLLETRPADAQALRRFQQLLVPLTRAPDAVRAPEDNGEVALIEDDPLEVFQRFATVTPLPETGGGTASGGNPFEALWSGAREALRQATYWQMKRRAGQVGQHGVGPLVGRLHEREAGLRLHLAGHSFGARVVAFALAGLPPDGTSPVKSVLLLQGAFSHFAFADALPHNRQQAGALAGMASRVDGPLMVTFSALDTALSQAYPLASIASGDDTAAFEDRLFQWGAIGHRGAQAVPAARLSIGDVGQRYDFAAGAIVNLDGNALIVAGEPPGGAHGDIFHPQIAWAALIGAGLLQAT